MNPIRSIVLTEFQSFKITYMIHSLKPKLKNIKYRFFFNCNFQISSSEQKFDKFQKLNFVILLNEKSILKLNLTILK